MRLKDFGSASNGEVTASESGLGLGLKGPLLWRGILSVRLSLPEMEKSQLFLCPGNLLPRGQVRLSCHPKNLIPLKAQDLSVNVQRKNEAPAEPANGNHQEG